MALGYLCAKGLAYHFIVKETTQTILENTSNLDLDDGHVIGSLQGRN